MRTYSLGYTETFSISKCAMKSGKWQWKLSEITVLSRAKISIDSPHENRVDISRNIMIEQCSNDEFSITRHVGRMGMGKIATISVTYPQ